MSKPEVAYKTSTYYVKPTFHVKKGKVAQASYAYFDENGKQVVSPTAEYLRAENQGGNGDFVRFFMREAEFLYQSDDETTKPSGVNHTVQLYGAVAKTLIESKQVPNFIISNDNKGLIIPIFKGTERGVILIFQVFQNNRFVQLVASPDPEIGNSTDGA